MAELESKLSAVEQTWPLVLAVLGAFGIAFSGILFVFGGRRLGATLLRYSMVAVVGGSLAEASGMNDADWRQWLPDYVDSDIVLYVLYAMAFLVAMNFLGHFLALFVGYGAANSATGNLLSTVIVTVEAFAKLWGWPRFFGLWPILEGGRSLMPPIHDVFEISQKSKRSRGASVPASKSTRILDRLSTGVFPGTRAIPCCRAGERVAAFFARQGLVIALRFGQDRRRFEPIAEFSAIATSELAPDAADANAVREGVLCLVRPYERVRWDALMDEQHYLSFKGFPGRGLRYVFQHGRKWLALIG